MEFLPIDFTAKVLIVGDTGVGKSCLMTKYLDGVFYNNCVSTIGIDFKFKTVQVEDVRVKLQIWDTAGQERFHSITWSYYRATHGFVLMFGLNDSRTFHSLPIWLKEIRKRVGEDVPVLLVGNKADLVGRMIEKKEAHEFAREHCMQYIETSVKNAGVDEVFQRLAALIVEHKKKGGWVSIAERNRVNLAKKSESKCCTLQ